MHELGKFPRGEITTRGRPLHLLHARCAAWSELRFPAPHLRVRASSIEADPERNCGIGVNSRMDNQLQRKDWRRGSESNRRIKVLQTSPLPLGYRALSPTRQRSDKLKSARNEPAVDKILERETGFEPATSTLARSHSTTELLPLVHSFYSTCAFTANSR